jgi:HD-GYP domain-containing protein (c-di-GMP phosphodiesterase class II)
VEFALVQTHVERGYEILRPIEFPWPIADLVRQHHERLDGSGYPQGLIGDEILFESRILAVADTIEAVASDRPYRAALGIDAALRVIRDGSGTIFDAACVEACEAVAPQILARSAQG